LSEPVASAGGGAAELCSAPSHAVVAGDGFGEDAARFAPCESSRQHRGTAALDDIDWSLPERCEDLQPDSLSLAARSKHLWQQPRRSGWMGRVACAGERPTAAPRRTLAGGWRGPCWDPRFSRPEGFRAVSSGLIVTLRLCCCSPGGRTCQQPGAVAGLGGAHQMGGALQLGGVTF